MTDRRVLYATAVYDHEEIEAILGVLDGRRRNPPDRQERRRDGTPGRRAVRQGRGRDVQLRLVGAVPRGGAARPPGRLGGDHLTADVLDRPRAARPRRGSSRSSSTSSPTPSTSTSTAIEPMIAPDDAGDPVAEPRRQRARLGPDPRARRRHGLAVVEDSCDALGATSATGHRPAPAPTSRSRASRSRTSSRARATAAWCSSTTTRNATGACSLRRWGRRSEPQLYGSRRGERSFWEDLDGIRYDNLFIFDDVGWNFEPSELGAAFGLRQLDKLPVNSARRQRNFALYTEFLERTSRPVHPAATARRARHRVAVVRVPRPTGCRVRPQRPAAVPRAARDRHPHGLDR